MSQTKGFTLIEMIVVLSILLSLTLISLPYYKHSTLIKVEDVEYQISSLINQAKSASLIYHQRVDLDISDHQISYTLDDKIYSYHLPSSYSFSDIKEIYFNENGNINQANTITFHYGNKTKKLIFHLGSGHHVFEN